MTSSPKSPWILALVLSAVSALVFSGVWRAEFVEWENKVNIYENPNVHGLTAAHVRWAFTDVEYVPRYMPLGWLSYAASYEISGLNPIAHHAGNLLLHAFNTALVFFLARRVLALASASPSSSPGTADLNDSRTLWGATVVTLLWGLHPLRVETVALGSARIYCQAATLALACVLAWFRAQDAPVNSRRRRGWLAVSVVSYVASLLTYPIAMTLPAVLLVMDALLLRRFANGFIRNGGWRVWLEKVPFGVAAVLVAGVTLRLAGGTDRWQQLPGAGEFGTLSRAAQAFYVMAYYVWKHALPTDLTQVYPALVSFDPVSWIFVASAMGVLAGSAWVFWRWRQWPVVAALWATYLLLVLPFTGLAQHPHHTYDRYSYLPGIVWALALVALAGALCREPRIWRGVCLGLACLSAGLGLASHRQVSVWNNTISLYEHLTAHYPARPDRAKYDIVLGRSYEKAGQREAALRCFETAVRLAPGLADARVHLAEALIRNGQSEPAIAQYREALKGDPDNFTARQNLGVTFGSLGRYEEALTEFLGALRLKPGSPEVHRNLAITYRSRGQTNEALLHWKLAHSAIQ